MLIRKNEFYFVGFISLVVILITLIPLVVGFWFTPPHSSFLGTQRLNTLDTPVYYSWIEQVREGHFLFKNLFTGEPHPRFILDVFWLSVGLIAKIFSLSSLAAYQIARIALIPILLGICYLFIAYFFEEEKKRQLCFFILAFASGWGGYVALGQTFNLYNYTTPPIDIWVAETSTFYTLYHVPHFIFSYTLMVLIFLLMLYAFEKQKIIYSLAAGLASLVLANFHPYFVPTVFGALGLYLIILTVKDKKIRWDLIKHAFILGLLTLPSILYHFWALQTFWIRRQHALQNNLPTPGWGNIFLAWGALAILSLMGLASLCGKKIKNKDLFLISWLLTTLILMYAPLVNYQRRMVEGLPIVLVILNVYGLLLIKEILDYKKISLDKFWKNKFSIIAIFFFVFCFSDYFVIRRDILVYASQKAFPQGAYISDDKKQAMLWLKNNTPADSVVLATYANSNLLPPFALRPVYFGHWGMTAEANKKSQQIIKFFTLAKDEERAVFLRQEHINYLFYGLEEKKFVDFQPEKATYLKLVFQNAEISIYKVD